MLLHSFFFLQINEIAPEEKCQLKPHRMCHPVRRSRKRRVRLLKRRAQDSDNVNKPGHYRQCRMAPRQRCDRRRVNPRPVVREMRKTVCRDPGPADAELMRRLLDEARDTAQELDNDVFV